MAGPVCESAPGWDEQSAAEELHAKGQGQSDVPDEESMFVTEEQGQPGAPEGEPVPEAEPGPPAEPVKEPEPEPEEGMPDREGEDPADQEGESLSEGEQDEKPPTTAAPEEDEAGEEAPALPVPEEDAAEEEAAEEEAGAEKAEGTDPAASALSGLVCSKAVAGPGEEIVWRFEGEGAEDIRYVILNASGETVAEGSPGEAREIAWCCGTGGRYTLVLSAGGGAVTLRSEVMVSSGELAAELFSDRRYAVAGYEALVFDTRVSGGVAPYAVHYRIELEGQPVYESSGYAPFVCYLPDEFGIHSLIMRVSDASGAEARAEMSIPVARRDRESPASWERSFAHVELTGDYARDILAIAQTQIGYRESARDFIVDEAGRVCGYTRYGAWYGSAYADWCAMFVSFAAAYAGIPESILPREAGTLSLRRKLGGLYIPAGEGYQPLPGDYIFLDNDGDGSPEHMGIVSAVGDFISSIQGNTEDEVALRSHAADDPIIIGYMSMALAQRKAEKAGLIAQAAQPDEAAPPRQELPPEGAPALQRPPDDEDEVYVPLCGLREHSHSEGCYDAEGREICGMTAHSHGAACYATKAEEVRGIDQAGGPGKLTEPEETGEPEEYGKLIKPDD